MLWSCFGSCFLLSDRFVLARSFAALSFRCLFAYRVRFVTVFLVYLSGSCSFAETWLVRERREEREREREEDASTRSKKEKVKLVGLSTKVITEG